MRPWRSSTATNWKDDDWRSSGAFLKVCSAIKRSHPSQSTTACLTRPCNITTTHLTRATSTATRLLAQHRGLLAPTRTHTAQYHRTTWHRDLRRAWNTITRPPQIIRATTTGPAMASLPLTASVAVVLLSTLWSIMSLVRDSVNAWFSELIGVFDSAAPPQYGQYYAYPPQSMMYPGYPPSSTSPAASKSRYRPY